MSQLDRPADPGFDDDGPVDGCPCEDCEDCVDVAAWQAEFGGAL